MPEEQQSNNVKVILSILGVAILVALVFFFVQMKSTPNSEEQLDPSVEETDAVPATLPEDMVPTTPLPDVSDAPPPAPVTLSEDIETQIKAINAEVDAGKITLEEAQEKVNKLLGL